MGVQTEKPGRYLHVQFSCYKRLRVYPQPVCVHTVKCKFPRFVQH